jgi:nitrile hydratase subunit beta
MAYTDKFRGYHDIGGLDCKEVDTQDRPMELWEKRVHAMVMLLTDQKRNILRIDEYRRGVETLGEDVYKKESYYARWLGSVTNLLLLKGVITSAELGEKLAEIDKRSAEEQ